MSLSKYLTEYLSESESGELTSSDDEDAPISKPYVKSLPVNTLSFCAHMSQSLSKVTSYRGVIFDVIDTNDDNCYNVTTGRFTAPQKGMYVFFTTITSTERIQCTLCFIHKFHPVDQAKVKQREQQVEGFCTKTIAVVLNLDKEDEVWVLNLTKAVLVRDMEEPYYTSFSGGLVEPEQ